MLPKPDRCKKCSAAIILGLGFLAFANIQNVACIIFDWYITASMGSYRSPLVPMPGLSLFWYTATICLQWQIHHNKWRLHVLWLKLQSIKTLFSLYFYEFFLYRFPEAFISSRKIFPICVIELFHLYITIYFSLYVYLWPIILTKTTLILCMLSI